MSGPVYRNNVALVKSLESKAPKTESVSLSVVTSDFSSLSINAGNFTANNVNFVNGNVLASNPNEDHAVFGSEDGTRTITTNSTYELEKGSYIAFKCIRGETSGGSIELDDDPDNNEDLVVEVSSDNITYITLPGRITEDNSSSSKYIEYRFLMTQDDGDYYIRVRQTDHSGDGTDYYALKDFKYNVETVLYDSANEIKLFL
jgi:hypothetical protein